MELREISDENSVPDSTIPVALTAKYVVAPVVSSNLAAIKSFFKSLNNRSLVKVKLTPSSDEKIEPCFSVGK